MNALTHTWGGSDTTTVIIAAGSAVLVLICVPVCCLLAARRRRRLKFARFTDEARVTSTPGAPAGLRVVDSPLTLSAMQMHKEI